MTDWNDRAALGFGLVCAAGMSTCLGALVIYSSTLVKLVSKRVLAAGLSISAGVMIYVSFIEIFYKSVDSFTAYVKEAFPGSKKQEQLALGFATLCFFGGVAAMKIIDQVVHLLRFLEEKRKEKRHRKEKMVSRPDDIHGMEMMDANASSDSEECRGHDITMTQAPSIPERHVPPVGPCMCHLDEHVAPILDGANMAKDSRESQKLIRMGMNTALAIGIHNFPEGLATFIGTLESPEVGVSLAVAIAIHNIPEGLCVAIPVFYATGSRHKAFLWAFLSGLSEPVGAGLGWIVLYKYNSPVIFAIAFGFIAGMMVAIAAHELIPTAHRYDPKDNISTNMFTLGMAVIALSLVLLK